MTLADAQAHADKHGYNLDVRFPDLKRGGKSGHLPGKKPRQNKTELAFGLILEAMKRKGEIVDYQFEGITLRLADDCKFTPDFFIVVSLKPLKLRFCETKGGHIWDDSKVKFRVAREQFPWAEWEMHQKSKAGWKRLL